MADKTLTLDIVTPDRNLFSGEVNMVIAPATDGEIGILPLHAPLLSELNVGKLRYKFDKDGKEYEEIVAIDGGFLEVFEDKVTVITSGAEFAHEIDVEKVRAAHSLAEEEIKTEGANVESARISLARAESRLRIAKHITK